MFKTARNTKSIGEIEMKMLWDDELGSRLSSTQYAASLDTGLRMYKLPKEIKHFT